MKKIVFYFPNETLERDFNLTGFSQTENYYQNLNPVDDSIKLSVQYDLDLSNSLKLFKNDNVKVQIVNEDLTNYFTGYLRKTTSFLKTQINQDIQLELVSPSFFLDVDTKEQICETECQIQTAITRLLAAAGFTQAKGLSVATAVIPYFFVDVGENVYDVLAQLCKEYGYIFSFDADGFFTIKPIFNSPPTVITQIFDGTNTYGEIKQELKEEEADGVTASWNEITFVENVTVFKDTSNGDATYDCKIQVAPGKYLFEKEINFCEYDSEAGEIKYVTSITGDFVHDSQIEILQCENLGTKALISAKNNSSTGQYRFTKFEIRGSAYVSSADNTSTVANGTKKNKDVTVKYIYDKVGVNTYITNLTNWYRYADITIALNSYDDFELGSFVTVSAYGMGDLNGRIIQKKRTGLSEMISYTVEGISDFIPATIEDVGHKQPTPIFITEKQLINIRSETRYTRSAEKPQSPTGASPAGWTITIPEGSENIWMSVAGFNFDGTISSLWTEPTKFSIASTAIGQLTNDSSIIFFDDGGQGDFTGIESSLLIYEAGRNTTNTWAIGANPSAGVTGTLTANLFVVTGLTTDSGFVDFIANRSGMDTITKRFTLTRASKSSADVVSMSVSSTVIVAKGDGTCSPENIIFTSTVAHGQVASEPYNGVFKIYADDILLLTTGAVEQYVFSSYDVYPYPSPNKFPSNTYFPSNTLIDRDIVRLRVELYDETGLVKLDSQSLTVTKDLGIGLKEILAENSSIIADYSPKYLGKFLDMTPTTYHPGDTFLIYGLDDTPYQRGVYLVKNDLSLERLTGDINQSSAFVLALPDIMAVSNAGFGALTNYGQITFISNLVTNSAFTQSLVVQNTNLGTTIIDGGKIKTNLLDVENILGQDAVFSGTLVAAKGSFSGSISAGGLEIAVAPPVTQSFVTNSKKVSAFIDEITGSGIALGRYACSGSYGAMALQAITFAAPTSTISTETFTSKVATGNFVVTSWGDYGNPLTVNYEFIEATWRRDTTQISYSVIFADPDGVTTTVNGIKKPANSWVLLSSLTKWTGSISVGGFQSIPEPTGTTTASDTSPTLANGSVNFSAASFTMKLKNLPAYSASLPIGTVFVADSGNGYDFLCVKK